MKDTDLLSHGTKILTKSRYLAGLESSAYLWKMVHGQLPLPKDTLRIEAGKMIGELAKKLYDGVDLSSLSFEKNLEQTATLVSQRKVIFEAGFLRDRLYARIDILVPVDGGWDIIEVKSSSSVKEVHIADVSFQKHVCGLPIRKCFVLHINNEYIREGELSIKDLFILSEVETYEVTVDPMLAVIDCAECPAFDYHDIPKSVYGNPCIDEFYDQLPFGSVFELYNIRKKKAIELYDAGITSILDIPKDISTDTLTNTPTELHKDLNKGLNTKLSKQLQDTVAGKLTDKQRIQVACAHSGKRHIDAHAIKTFLDSLTAPIQYLDFETFTSAIPLFDGCKPNQHIPFQYSLHIEEKHEAMKKHKEFLFTTQGDPRLAFLEALSCAIEPSGSIVVYNKSFEVSRLRELKEAFPSYSSFIDSVLARIVDLLDPFRLFMFYDARQQGSCSIKKVLPLFSSLSYDALEVSNGTEAMELYFRHFVQGESCPDKEQLVKDLLDYCKLDTWGMVVIVEGLKKMVQEATVDTQIL